MKKFLAKVSFECKTRKPSQFDVFASSEVAAAEKARAAIATKYLERGIPATVVVEFIRPTL